MTVGFDENGGEPKDEEEGYFIVWALWLKEIARLVCMETCEALDNDEWREELGCVSVVLDV